MTFVRQNRPIPQFDNHERFLSKVSVNSTTGCWDWNAGCIPCGYGLFRVPANERKAYTRGNTQKRGERNFSAHRVCWSIFKGALSPHLVLDHTCRNRKCVNPDHLREVDEYVNGTENSVSVQAINAQKTHCIHGHEFTPENTIISNREGRVGRKCRKCKNRIGAKRYWKSPAGIRNIQKLLKELI